MTTHSLPSELEGVVGYSGGEEILKLLLGGVLLLALLALVVVLVASPLWSVASPLVAPVSW